MEGTQPPYIDDERQRTLEHNVWASADNSATSALVLKNIFYVLNHIRWGVGACALFLFLLLFK